MKITIFKNSLNAHSVHDLTFSGVDVSVAKPLFNFPPEVRHTVQCLVCKQNPYECRVVISCGTVYYAVQVVGKICGVLELLLSKLYFRYFLVNCREH